METIFNHTPTQAELEALGVPPIEKDLLALYRSQNAHFMLICDLYELRGQPDKVDEYKAKRGEGAVAHPGSFDDLA